MRRHLALLALTALGACKSAPGYDYTNLIERAPRSILVLPPLDETVETEATYGCLSTLTRPLAERGFYVFPVAVVDGMMRDNGLPTPGEMHQVPLAKLREVFGPDAVLYVTVTDWGTSYQVLASTTEVTIEAVLVDAETGTELWRGRQTGARGSGDAGGGLAGMIASALVNQVVTSIDDPSVDVARSAAYGLFYSDRGLLPGPYAPDYEKRMQAARAKMAENQANAQ